MAKNKMNIPQIRFKGFEGEWGLQKLSQISTRVQEKNKDNKIIETFTNSAEKGIISQREFFDKDISNEANLHNYYVVSPNDFVYNPRISNFAPVGPIKRNKLGKRGVMSPLYSVFRPNPDAVVLDFLEYYFTTTNWHRFMHTNGDQGARSDRFAIAISTFQKMPIYAPELVEQTQIGDFFQKIDQVIELQQKALDTARAYKQSMLQKMFPQKGEKVPRVRFAGFSGDWDKYYLADIVHQVRSYSLSRGVETEDYTGVKYIHYGDIHLGKARYLQTDEELSFINFDIDCTVLQQGDLVVADASEDYLGIAEPCVINFEPQTKLVAGLHTIAIRPDQSQNSIFLFYYFKTKQFKKHCYRVGTGMKVFGITFNNLSKYEGYFPNKEEQIAIGNFFQKLDQQIEQQAQKLATYQQLKKAMLQRMFV